MAAGRPDILEIVEAAYQVDRPDREWLGGLAKAVQPHLDEGFGLTAFEFHRPEGAAPHIVQWSRLGIPEKLAEIYPLVFSTMDPEIRERPFRMGPCVTGSQMMGMREEFRNQPHMQRHAQRFGMFDSIWITAAEPSGHGCGFHAGRSRIAWASKPQMRRWGQLAAHLATAVRLRHRMKTLASTQPAPPEAVLDPTGKIHDASGAAASASARVLLRDAVRVLEKSRGRMRKTEPDKSLEGWKALVSGRWSLIDQFENDGKRYILARENEPRAPGPPPLSEREKQVIAYAQLGHHNKLIAYELGISPSTVRVLIARAAEKLGVRGRAELIRLVGTKR